MVFADNQSLQKHYVKKNTVNQALLNQNPRFPRQHVISHVTDGDDPLLPPKQQLVPADKTDWGGDQRGSISVRGNEVHSLYINVRSLRGLAFSLMCVFIDTSPCFDPNSY